MKIITCIDCDKQFNSDTKEEVTKAMHPHYMEDHRDVMVVANEDDKKRWFTELDRRWEAAPEV